MATGVIEAPWTPIRRAEPSLAERLALLPPDEFDAELNRLTGNDPARAYALLHSWRRFWARSNQVLPEGTAWRFWLRLAGRGEGKTRSGAEGVKEWVGGRDSPPIRLAFVAETAADVRDVMVEGESGILAISDPDNFPTYTPSRRRLEWPNGSLALTFSGDKPRQLRGPQFHNAWVDEWAKYQYPEEVMDNLEFALRLGDSPQGIITTTPRPLPCVKAMLTDPDVIVSAGTSYDNLANLSPKFIQRVIRKYEGTRLGRQELLAELLEDVEGALWTLAQIDADRVRVAPAGLVRQVVAVDPAMSSQAYSNETGIMLCAKGADGHGYLLRDASGIYTPEQWASIAVALFRENQCSAIVAEKNQGGDLVKVNIKAIDPVVADCVQLVTAVSGKGARAQPIALLSEQHKIHHVGAFPALEDQMVAMTLDTYLGGGSPDRVDAMVWGFTKLLIEPSEWGEFAWKV